jgi:hypothetical protein
MADDRVHPAYGAPEPEVVLSEGENDVFNPDHYRLGDIEVIELIEDAGFERAFCVGSAVKYLTRAGRKAGASEEEDLGKALWYLEREAGSDAPLPQPVLRDYPEDTIREAFAYMASSEAEGVVLLDVLVACLFDVEGEALELLRTYLAIEPDEGEDEGIDMCECFFDAEPGAVVYVDTHGAKHLVSADGVWCPQGVARRG